MFRSLGHKILMLIGAVLIAGLLLLSLFYSRSEERSILAENERTTEKLLASVSESIQTLALAGYADILRPYADRLKKLPDLEDFRVLRVDGTEAFRDNQTIRAVNRFLGEARFAERGEEDPVRILADDDPKLHAALERRETVRYETRGPRGEPFLTYLAPVLNRAGCQRCHASQQPVRGVLKLTVSLQAVREEIDAAWRRSLLGVGLLTAGIMLVIGLLLRRAVMAPIGRVTSAITRAAGGDLRQQVPVIGRDELSVMARSCNRMISELLKSYTGLKNEKDKLRTLILSAREGIIVTDKEGAIVLVNDAAEELLEKPAAQIEREGFSQLFDDPKVMASLLLGTTGDVLAPLSYKNRLLAVEAETIRDPDGAPLGSACLIRDVSNQKRLEDELRQISVTDPLTGVYNRRHFDHVLASEFKRAQRYGTPLSLIICDIDHFKRVNDTHGHERGDQVLKGVALRLQRSLRDSDHCCRYGGEEFCLLLPSSPCAGALKVADRIRRTIESATIDGLKVTMSFGVASVQESVVSNASDLVRRADEALYAAKAAGRNAVIAAPARN